jgi:hypothetical protein
LDTLEPECGAVLFNTVNFPLLKSWEFVLDSGRYEARYNLAIVKPKPADNLAFKDDDISILFAAEPKDMAFGVKNKTDHAMHVDWNQVALVDPSGKSHQVIHQGIKFSEKDSSKTPTVIPPGARIEDMVMSADSVRMGSREWILEDLLPPGPQAEKLRAGQFSIFLPLEINGKTVDYNFVFAIRDIAYQ